MRTEGRVSQEPGEVGDGALVPFAVVSLLDLERPGVPNTCARAHQECQAWSRFLIPATHLLVSCLNQL